MKFLRTTDLQYTQGPKMISSIIYLVQKINHLPQTYPIFQISVHLVTALTSGL